jgi:hypothetical protein
MTGRRFLFRLGIVGLTLAIWSLSNVVIHAEVGASVGSGPTASVMPYAMSPIVDDPDPTSSITWQRYAPDTLQRVILNDQGFANGDGAPSILYNPVSSVPVVAWSRNSPAGFDLVVSTVVSGAWSTPQVVASGPDDELDPYLALDPSDGSVHLFYWVDDAMPRVMYRSAPSDLSTWSSPILVSQFTEAAARPSAVFVEGELQVVYENHMSGLGGAPREIVWTTFDGVSFSGEVLVLTPCAETNWPQIHTATGRVWVDWIDGEGMMTWIRRVLPGGWEQLQLEPFESIEKRDYHVRGTVRVRALE